MARTEDWFGLAGVAWLSGLLEVLLFLGVYAAVRGRAEPLVAMPVTGVALYAMQSGLSMRPQVVSYLFTAVVVGGLAAHARRPAGPLVAGPVWYGYGRCCTGCGRSRWSSAPSRRSAGARPGPARRRPALGAATVRARSRRPSLRRARPLRRRGAAVPARAYFAEWLPPDWVSWQSGGFAVLLAATLVGLWGRRRDSWTVDRCLIVLAGGSRRTPIAPGGPSAPRCSHPRAAAPPAGRCSPAGRRSLGVEQRAVLGGAAVALVVLVLGLPVENFALVPYAPVPGRVLRRTRWFRPRSCMESGSEAVSKPNRHGFQSDASLSLTDIWVKVFRSSSRPQRSSQRCTLRVDQQLGIALAD